MFLPVFHDLIKPQWKAVLEELKLSGEMSASDLARSIGTSYMSIKSYCEELTRAGYVVRTRLPRSAVGRPEILYSLSNKADALFPQAGADFSLELLAEARCVFGENAPEKLLFRYFQNQTANLARILGKIPTITGRAEKIVSTRNRQGCAGFCKQDPGEPLRIVEVHNPLQKIIQSYPSTAAMEQRMLEQLLGTKVIRRELPGGRDASPCVVFDIL